METNSFGIWTKKMLEYEKLEPDAKRRLRKIKDGHEPCIQCKASLVDHVSGKCRTCRTVRCPRCDRLRMERTIISVYCWKCTETMKRIDQQM